MHIRTTGTAVLAALALTLVGCSSDSDDNADKKPPTAAPSTTAAPTSKPPADTAALEHSVREYTRALFAPDAAAGYALLSTRCKGQMTAAEFKTLAAQAHQQYGALTIKTIHVDQQSGDLARVSYGVGVPQFERKGQPWTREAGVWKWDACQGA